MNDIAQMLAEREAAHPELVAWFDEATNPGSLMVEEGEEVRDLRLDDAHNIRGRDNYQDFADMTKSMDMPYCYRICVPAHIIFVDRKSRKKRKSKERKKISFQRQALRLMALRGLK